MAIFNIPVSWESNKTIKIEADTITDAIKYANKGLSNVLSDSCNIRDFKSLIESYEF